MYKCAICGKTINNLFYHERKVWNPRKEMYEAFYTCDSCQIEWNERGNAINEYSYKPDPMFINAGDSDLYLGVELEADGGFDPSFAAARISIPYDEFYIKRDGSLDTNGIEIVTHPGTLSAHKNNILHWKEVISILKSQHYRSHKTSTCGLHVHVNRDFFGNTAEEIDLNVSKVILLTQRFWDNCIVPFSRRNLNRLNRWAKKPTRKFQKGSSGEMITKTHKDTMSRDHYNGVNIMPRNTIEFRMFRGTLNYNTLIATLEFVYLLCHFAKKISIDDIDNTKWEDIFEGVDVAEFEALFIYMASRKELNKGDNEDVFVQHDAVIRVKTDRSFAVGDRVRIREWNDMIEEFGYEAGYHNINCMYIFTSEMNFMCGEAATIMNIVPYGSGSVCYKLDFDNRNINDLADCYMISADMIEHYDN